MAGTVRLGPMMTALRSTLEPAFIVVPAAVYRRAALLPPQIVGVALVQAAVVLLSLPDRSAPAGRAPSV